MQVVAYQPKNYFVDITGFDRRSGTYNALVDGLPCVLARTAHSGHLAAGRSELLYGRLFSDRQRRVLIPLDSTLGPADQELESKGWYSLFLVCRGDSRLALPQRSLTAVFRSGFLERFPDYQQHVIKGVEMAAGNAAAAALGRLEHRCARSSWDQRSETELRTALKWLAYCGADSEAFGLRLAELVRVYGKS